MRSSHSLQLRIRRYDTLDYQSSGQARLLGRVAGNGGHGCHVFQAVSLFRFPQAHFLTPIYYQVYSSLTNVTPTCDKWALQLYRFSSPGFSEDVKYHSRRTIPVQARSLA